MKQNKILQEGLELYQGSLFLCKGGLILYG